MIDIHAFESLVYWYACRETTISPLQWELIITSSFDGEHIGGDIYMADGKVGETGLNIKSIKVSKPKGNIITKDYIQCRTPIQSEMTLSDQEIGRMSISTLIQKRDESFADHSLNKMLDIVVIHNREGDIYNASLFVNEHPDYAAMELNWVNGMAYLPDNPEQWILRRIPSYASAYQNCLKVKKKYNMNDAVASVSLKIEDPGNVSVAVAKRFFRDTYRR